MTTEQGIERIKKMAQFKDNWNGYGSKAFSPSVIARALLLIEGMEPPPLVSPTGRDSIQFEWVNKELYLEMEIFSDGIKIYNTYADEVDIGGK